MNGFNDASAGIRITNDERKTVCTVSRVNPMVAPATAVGFAAAVAALYNKGQCTARINMSGNIPVA